MRKSGRLERNLCFLKRCHHSKTQGKHPPQNQRNRSANLLDLDGAGNYSNTTGIGFFDHMLDQLAKHSGCNLEVKAKGDLHIDEHHTVEDVGITLGQAFKEALGDKRGINRYGHFLLPMDDALVQAAIDFSGRPCLVWQAEFRQRKSGRNAYRNV